ncbi:hypothetical protein BC833DRAFT_621599, partial [Globomyces pollinis-pini]
MKIASKLVLLLAAIYALPTGNIYEKYKRDITHAYTPKRNDLIDIRKRLVERQDNETEEETENVEYIEDPITTEEETIDKIEEPAEPIEQL